MKNVHDQGEVTLSNGAKTSIWIGVDPNHSEADVKEALCAGNIGKLSTSRMSKFCELRRN